MSAQRGQILPMFALFLTLLLLPVAGLAVDGGVLITDHAALAGVSQSAAEAASQALDVTKLDRNGSFQLCTSPDGSPSCGNGVGTVAQVVQGVVSAAGQPGECGAGSGPGATCAYQVLDSCGAPAQGVEVSLAQTVQLPMLTFGPWGKVTLTAQATSWMQHGYASPIDGAQARC